MIPIAVCEVAGTRTNANGPSFRRMPVNPRLQSSTWQKAQVCKLNFWKLLVQPWQRQQKSETASELGIALKGPDGTMIKVTVMDKLIQSLQSPDK